MAELWCILTVYRNLLGVVASNGEALVMGLAIPSFYRVLAFSGQTSRKREALAREVAVPDLSLCNAVLSS